MTNKAPWGAHYILQNIKGAEIDTYYLKLSEKCMYMVSQAPESNPTGCIYDFDNDVFEMILFISDKCVVDSKPMDVHISEMKKYGSLVVKEHKGSITVSAELVKDGKVKVKLELSEDIDNIHPFGLAYESLTTLPVRIEDRFGVNRLNEIITEQTKIDQLVSLLDKGRAENLTSMKALTDSFEEDSGIPIGILKQKLREKFDM